MKKLVAAVLAALVLGACSGTTVVAPRVKYNPDGTIEVGVEIGITRLKVAKLADGTTEVVVENVDPAATNAVALAGVPTSTVCRTVE